MKLSKQGISFSYHGDELLWLWPWKRRESYLYYSSIHDMGFPSLREYWYFCGGWNEACRKEKIIGFTENDILVSWAKKEFRHNTVIILRNINVQMKSTVFWKSVDIFARRELLKDTPVIFLPDLKNAEYILGSIPIEFAEAYLFHRGELVETNREDYIKQIGKPVTGDNPGPR